ncbi:MAG: FecR family protein [Candidatus Margulisbacteria bacterium]|nr:FecR family protein [Candidatus Margulisiibacteriota bacterium]
MKKVILFLILSLLTGILFSQIKEGSPIASLTFFLGEVAYKSKDMKEWAPAKKGMAFYEGDYLKTYTDGKAELFFYTGSKVRIANGTEIEFTRNEAKKEKGVFIHMGQVWNSIRKGDKFSVESIHGVASVKGTEFDVVNSGDNMEIWVKEGLVLIENQNGQVLAGKNTQTTISKDGKADLQNITDEDLKKMMNWKDAFSAEALLLVSAPGNKQEDKPFKFFITLKDAKNDRLFSGEVEVKIKSLSKTLGLALSDSSADWKDELDLKIIDGKAEVWAKGANGKHEISISGKYFTGINVPFDIQGVISSRTVNLKFMGKDNKEHNINIKYKLK